MSNVKRVYVEKKPGFAVQAEELKHEVKSYLGIKDIQNIRVLIRYDVEISPKILLRKHATAYLQNRRLTLCMKRSSRVRREAGYFP